MKSLHYLRIRAGILLSALLIACGAPLLGNEALHWNRVAVDATTQAMPYDPITESRILAIVHLSMHDAANAVQARYQPYGAVLPAAPGGSVDAAVAYAAHTALCQLLPSARVQFDAELAVTEAIVPSGAARESGAASGRAAASQILALRNRDGSDQSITVAAGTKPGEYRPTPPDFTPAYLGHWGRVRPFTLTASEQFRPAPPPAPDSAESRADIEEVRRLGGASEGQRTHEQSEIACFWYEQSTRSWNRIARDVGVSRQFDTCEQAHLFALVNLAMADGFIGGFEAKYHYLRWRPATAIRENGEPTWLSYLGTPPVPDYPSTHAVLGASVATVMARSLGSDFISFSLTSGNPYPNITRRFWSFSQAARENAASRVFAGIHFPTAVDAGYRQGAQIGTWVFEHALQPIGPQRTVNAPGK